MSPADNRKTREGFGGGVKRPRNRPCPPQTLAYRIPQVFHLKPEQVAITTDGGYFLPLKVGDELSTGRSTTQTTETTAASGRSDDRNNNLSRKYRKVKLYTVEI